MYDVSTDKTALLLISCNLFILQMRKFPFCKKAHIKEFDPVMVNNSNTIDTTIIEVYCSFLGRCSGPVEYTVVTVFSIQVLKSHWEPSDLEKGS